MADLKQGYSSELTMPYLFLYWKELPRWTLVWCYSHWSMSYCLGKTLVAWP